MEPNPTSPRRSLLVPLVALIVALAGAVTRGADGERAQVTQAVIDHTGAKPGDKVMAAVVLQIGEGFHAQSAKPTDEFNYRFRGSVEKTPGVVAGEPAFPAGEIVDLGDLGKQSVYTGTVTVYIPIEIAADAKPGEIKVAGSLGFQVCDDKSCFPPTTLKFEIPMTVVGAKDDVKPANAELFKKAAGPATKPAKDEKSVSAKAADDDEPVFEVLGSASASPLGSTASLPPSPTAARMTVRAVLSTSALQPGKQATLAVILSMTAGNHAQSHTPRITSDGPTFIPTDIKSLSAGDQALFGQAVFPPGVDEDLGDNGVLNVYSGQITILVPITVKAGTKLGEITVSGLVNAQICDATQCLQPADFAFELITKVVGPDETVTPNESEIFSGGAKTVPPPDGKAASAARTIKGIDRSLPASFGLAFLVGVLFNIVPCVLPVLPLKAIGFYETAQHNRAKSVTYGLAFSMGVVAAFGVLGLLVVVFKVFTWGELFSNPWFSGALVLILIAMAANMFGLFTVNLPAGAYAFSPRHDTYFGNFLFGILTAALSTPCTFGLFVSVLTVALLQPAAVGLLLIMVVGAGMASPYLVLSAMPELARKFPRAGPWAELVKQFMGFLILAVAIFFAQGWITRFIAEHLIYWVIFAVVAGGCVFLVARAVHYGKTPRAPAIAIIIALMIGVPGFFIAREFGVKRYDWKPYTPASLATLRAQDKVVIVEFTAAWCINCHTLEATVINDLDIRHAVADNHVEMVKADITDTAQPSYQFWKFEVKAVGVPLTLVYPRGGKDPISLPGIFSVDDLKAAISEATAEKTAMK